MSDLPQASIKPLPCPFCGSSDLTLTVDQHGWKIVQCDDCGTSGPCIDLEGDQYIDRWNTRATPAPSALEITKADIMARGETVLREMGPPSVKLTDKERVEVEHWRTWCEQADPSQRLIGAPRHLKCLVEIIDRLTTPVGECSEVTEQPNLLEHAEAALARKAIKGALNEVYGVWDAFEFGIRQEISNTNYAVVREKLDAAERALETLRLNGAGAGVGKP